MFFQIIYFFTFETSATASCGYMLYIYICGTGFWGLFRSPGYIRPLGISPAPTILFRGTHHTLNAPNMPRPLNSSPCTHTQAIYFNLIIFWIYFFPILCPSLTLSGVLSLHLFRWARRTWQVAWFSANPSKTLKHPHFQHCFFSICNVPSTCLLSLTCFAQPLFLILHSHISQWISIPSTTDIPLSIDCLNWGKMPLMRFCAQHFQKKIYQHFMGNSRASQLPTSLLIKFWTISFIQLLIRIIVSRC